jgi:hypothetical protein
MTKFSDATREFPRANTLPGGRVLHETGHTVRKPKAPDDENALKPRPSYQRRVFYFFR